MPIDYVDYEAIMRWELRQLIPNNFLYQLRKSRENYENLLRQRLKTHLENQGRFPPKFDELWCRVWEQIVNDQKRFSVFQGLKIGDKVVQSSCDSLRFGKIVEFDLCPQNKPIIIEWNNGDRKSFTLYEMLLFDVSRWFQIEISPQLVYQTSENRKFFRIFIGFKTKKAAKSWLRFLKNKLGRLSNLIIFPDEEKPTLHKYHYQVEKLKYKTEKKILKVLEELASLKFD